ncbi:hypothetical protein [Sinobacterium caligoides]|uniref:hypothetical protein n=1 Tax=Sinobacterium caligoides TaxID=933926 RepID=UPI0013C2CD81|nr:hypothetical protein [Sinobacterium caligoides]
MRKSHLSSIVGPFSVEQWLCEYTQPFDALQTKRLLGSLIGNNNIVDFFVCRRVDD